MENPTPTAPTQTPAEPVAAPPQDPATTPPTVSTPTQSTFSAPPEKSKSKLPLLIIILIALLLVAGALAYYFFFINKAVEPEITTVQPTQVPETPTPTIIDTTDAGLTQDESEIEINMSDLESQVESVNSGLTETTPNLQ